MNTEWRMTPSVHGGTWKNQQVALRQVALDELPGRQHDDREHAQADADAFEHGERARQGGDGAHRRRPRRRNVMVRLDLLAGGEANRDEGAALAQPWRCFVGHDLRRLLLACAVVGDELLDLHAELVRVDARLELGRGWPSPRCVNSLTISGGDSTTCRPAFFIDVERLLVLARAAS